MWSTVGAVLITYPLFCPAIYLSMFDTGLVSMKDECHTELVISPGNVPRMYKKPRQRGFHDNFRGLLESTRLA